MAVRAYFQDLLAAGRAEATVRSYGMDLLRWFRFLWAAEVSWDRATRAEARDFSRRLQVAGKQLRPHWRGQAGPPRPAELSGASRTRRRFVRTARRCCGLSTIFTWGRGPGRSSTRSRCIAPGVTDARTRTTIRWSTIATSAVAFTGRECPAGSRAACRTGSSTRSSRRCRRTGTGHWLPSTCPPERERRSCCRPRWRELIRDASYHGRAQGHPGAAAAAGLDRRVRLAAALPGGDGRSDPRGRRQPVWWALRRPARPLTYHAVHRMFERVNERAGTTATLHSLRHTAAYRMAEDPALPLTDVQPSWDMPSSRPLSFTSPRARRT